MPSSGLEDLDRAVTARRRERKRGQAAGRRAPGGRSEDRAAEVAPHGEGAPLVTSRRHGRGRTAQPGRIRSFGTLAGFAAPAAAGLLGLLLWAVAPSNGVSGAAPALLGYVLGLLAIPTLLFTGLPFYGGGWRVVLALASSAVLWLALGRWAAGRATRDIDASWRDYVIEIAVMTVGVWVGVLLGLVAMVLILSR